MSSLDYLELCRLCLVKERVSVPIFEGEGDVRQIFLKIAACLPVKVNREDKLPKKICDDCVYKVELFYQFWNTTANAEKQLLQWLGEVNLEDKQGYVTNVVNPAGMKPDQNTKNRLDGTVMQQVDEQQNNMGIGMMENMGLGMPMMMPNTNQQQITSVPMDSSGNSVQTVQAVPGPSTQSAHSQIQQNQTSTTQQEEEEEESEEDDNSDDECDGDEGLPVKEEGEEDPNRTIEPTTFVNVSLACDEAGPSGLQQQKIPEMPEMAIPQTPDGDPKSGSRTPKNSAVHAVRKRVLVSSLLNTTPVESKKRRQIETEKENQISSLAAKAPENASKKVEIKQEEIHIKHEILPETEINITMNIINCEQCGKIFYTRRSYVKHKGSVHVPSIYECDICKLKFKQMAAVRKHKIKVHKIKVHREAPLQNLMKPLSNIVNCDQCGKLFTTRRSYQKHKAVHAPKIYDCDICKLKFKKKYIVAKHKKAVHGESDPYICQYCDFKTHHRSYLNIHITRKHTDTYQFPCEKCDRKFRVKADFQKHMITHDGIPCICDICGVSLPNKMSLYFHKHYNHRTRENSFPCSICKKKLQSQKNLELHLEQHERRYICDECGLTLTRKCALKKHIRTHSGEKPHACDVCGRSFSSTSGRKVHMLTHSGIRPYICTVCGYSFTQRPALSVHWKKKHADVSVPPPAAVPIKSIIDNMTRRCAKIKSE